MSICKQAVTEFDSTCDKRTGSSEPACVYVDWQVEMPSLLWLLQTFPDNVG